MEIDVDVKTMRSSVAGLYAAGGLGGHSNGLIGLATYDGKVAAEGVIGDLPQLPPGVLPQAEAEDEAQRGWTGSWRRAGTGCRLRK